MALEDKVNIVNTRTGPKEKAPTPREIIDQRPLNGNEKIVYEGRKSVEAILDGRDKRLMMIVGPCSIHDVDQAVEYARRLKIVSDKVKDKIQILMRVYVEKPRSQVGWPGLLYDPKLDDTDNIALGMRLSREVFYEVVNLGLLTATELVDPIATQYYSDLLVYAAIGARTTETPTHRFMASGLSMPVGFKNTTSGDIGAAISAAITATQRHRFLGIDFDGVLTILGPTDGNPYSHIILRGGKDGPNYDEKSVSGALASLKKNNISLGLVIDASHANSGKDPTKQPQIVYDIINLRKTGKNIVGIMVESNIEGGSQNLQYPSPTKPNPTYGVSITDPCLGWNDTEKMIYTAHKML
jgi:3-deoxy-7-phosphoheptulonate synthase